MITIKNYVYTRTYTSKVSVLLTGRTCQRGYAVLVLKGRNTTGRIMEKQILNLWMVEGRSVEHIAAEFRLTISEVMAVLRKWWDV